MKILKREIKYIEYKENNNYYKYLLNRLNVRLSASYNCTDTKCEGRANCKIDLLNENQENEKFLIKDFKITKKHTLNLQDHNYIINKIIKDDIKYNRYNDLIEERLKNYKLRLIYLKEILFQNLIEIKNFNALKNFYISNII